MTAPGLSAARFLRAAECLRDDPWLVDASVSGDVADVLDRAAVLLDAGAVGSVDWPSLWVVVRRVEKEAKVPA